MTDKEKFKKLFDNVGIQYRDIDNYLRIVSDNKKVFWSEWLGNGIRFDSNGKFEKVTIQD